MFNFYNIISHFKKVTKTLKRENQKNKVKNELILIVI